MRFNHKTLALLLSMGITVSTLAGCSTTTTGTDTISTSVVTNADGSDTAEASTDDASSSASTEQQDTTEQNSDTAKTTSSATGTAELKAEDYISDRDSSGDYDTSEAIAITLNGTTASCDSDLVTIDGSTVTITGEGVFLLSGKLTDGQIIVDADSKDKVQLVLNGAEISSSSSAAIYIKQADKVFLTLAKGSQNTLSTTGEFTADGDTSVDGVVFSKDDLTVNGSGALTVTTEQGHGIVCKDELVITGGTLNVTASGHAIQVNDIVCISGGTFTLTAGKDGIHSENSDDTTLGHILITGGTFTITSDGDGLDAGSILQVEDGTFNITAGGGHENAAQKSGDKGGFGGGQWKQKDQKDSDTVTDRKSVV